MERYWRFAEDLFPPPGDDDGMPESLIGDAEAQIDERVQDLPAQRLARRHALPSRSPARA